ncbi:MAG: hypothetical protein ABR552_00435 [Actinomycetota bacterium]
MPRKKTTRARKKTAGRKRSAGRKKSTRSRRFICPECGFVAAHAMGLGRHRSARHGAVSKRQQMNRSSGGWLTREQAAERAGVHYNTIRLWERSGQVRARKQGRSVMIDVRSLSRARGSAESSVDVAAAMRELEGFFTELRTGLKRMMDAAEVSRAAVAKRRKR